MQPPVEAALIALIGVVLGWFANHWLTKRREESRRRLEAQLRFVECQIEELYGPMAAHLYEGRRVFLDLLDNLGRNHVFLANRPLPPEELQTWLFWVDAEFIPRNEQIKSLLKTKAHLIEGPEFPESYVRFLDHCNSWMINHRRWKEQGIEYSWKSKTNWPEDFEKEVLETFQILKRRHTQLIGALSVNVIAADCLRHR